MNIIEGKRAKKRLGTVSQRIRQGGQSRRSIPNRLSQTAPDYANEGKADRPPSCAVSALRPWPAGYKPSGDLGLGERPPDRVKNPGAALTQCVWEGLP